MKKYLATLLFAVCINSAHASVDPTKMVEDYQASETSAPINPDEAAASLAQWKEWAVFRLYTKTEGCSGLVVANVKTKTYQRLVDITCDDGVTNANIVESRDRMSHYIDFYNESELIGRFTVKEH